MKAFFITYLKGIVVGFGGIAPGLSGTVLMIIFGMYRRMLDALGNFFKDIKGNGKFLLPLVLELSYPAEVPYEEREKSYFRFEIFNEHYVLPTQGTP